MKKVQNNFKILNLKSKTDLILLLENNYGINLDYLKKFNFYLNQSSNKVHISNVNLENLSMTRFINIGIYFGTYHNNRFRLSLEGSKFIKPKKNYIKINDDSLKSYLAAENLFEDEVLEINKESNSTFLIVIYENDNLGSVSLKDGFFLNYIPKSRKLDYNKLF